MFLCSMFVGYTTNNSKCKSMFVWTSPHRRWSTANSCCAKKRRFLHAIHKNMHKIRSVLCWTNQSENSKWTVRRVRLAYPILEGEFGWKFNDIDRHRLLIWYSWHRKINGTKVSSYSNCKGKKYSETDFRYKLINLSLDYHHGHKKSWVLEVHLKGLQSIVLS